MWRQVNGNLNLSRSLGDCKYKQNRDLPWVAQLLSAEPDLVEEKITADDEFFALACDGVWDVMTNEQLVAFVRERQSAGNMPSAQICECVLDHCLAKDPKETRGIGSDNMTMVLVNLSTKERRQSSLPQN